jgi:hypothetical protein
MCMTEVRAVPDEDERPRRTGPSEASVSRDT